MHSVVNFGSLIDFWRAAHFYFAGHVFEIPGLAGNLLPAKQSHNYAGTKNNNKNTYRSKSN